MNREQKLANLRAVIEDDMAEIAKLKRRIESIEASMRGRLEAFMRLANEPGSRSPEGTEGGR